MSAYVLHVEARRLTLCSEDLYARLRATLLDRLRDKEGPIRAQAAVALSKLSFTEDLDELDEDDTPILDIVLDALAYDTSP